MGDTTYGKGLVQQLQRLGQGGQQIKFTIGKYYTPSGRCIQV
jgi:C-terminal processing protease CtpA/Prc